jgi:hypothetical protein
MFPRFTSLGYPAICSESAGGIKSPAIIIFKSAGSCADILMKGWDINQYCQDPEWKEVVVVWKNRQLHAVVREADEDRLDAEKGPFLKLSLEEARQAVIDRLKGTETVSEDPQESEDSGQ